MEHAERMLLGLSSVFVLGIGAQWIAWRLRVPSILLLLAFGFVAGPVTGRLDPDELFGELLFPLVSLSVALILFEGSLGLNLAELRGSGRALRNLLTIGVLVTWLVIALAAWWLLDFDLGISLLLGAMLTVTGPTVVGPMLRHIRPAGKIGSIARWEGIVIDPIGAVLAVLVFEVIDAIRATDFSVAFHEGSLGLLRTAAIGIIIGCASAGILTACLVRHWIPDRLQSPVALMLVAAALVGSNLLQHESGLLTVTVMGVVLANQRYATVKHILEFKENLSVLLISSLFILLAARVEPADFSAPGWRSTAFLAVVILVARPVAVFLSTLKSDLSWQERTFLAWLAPRGIVAAAVASVFAIRLGDDRILPATFLVIVGTVVVYGLTASPLARWLGLASVNPQGVLIASAHAGARAIAHAIQEAGFRAVLVDTNRWHVNAARMEGLEACYANILSEHVDEEVDLGGIGRFLAMTSNAEVNALAAQHFAELFGRANVYQLAPQQGGPSRTAMADEHLKGQFLFDPEATYEALDERFESGATIKTTNLSDEFDYEAFQQLYGDSALPLLLATTTDRLAIATAGQTLDPRPGQKLIALVDTPSEERNSEGDDAI